MATAFSPPTRWDNLRRPQTQPTRECGQETYRPSTLPRARDQPDQSAPAVIGSILNSFGALDKASAPRTVRPTTGTSHARPYTADGGADHRQSLVRSSTQPAAGAESYIQSWSHGREDQEDFASVVRSLPMRLSQPPSTLATLGARQKSLLSSPTSPRLRPTSAASQHSVTSTEGKERLSGARNKLSAESWVKGSGATSDLEHGAGQAPTAILRPPKKRPEIRPLDLNTSKLSRAEQIIARTMTPKMPSPKERLILTDTGINDEAEDRDTPPLAEEKPTRSTDQTGAIITDRTKETLRPIPAPNKRNSIVDSIPVRTSSLRQDSPSPKPGKKKEKKSRKSKTSSRIDSVFKSSAKQIPDSKWADLGEDDETVKRIRQLRERQHTRLMENRSVSTPAVLTNATMNTRQPSSTPTVQAPALESMSASSPGSPSQTVPVPALNSQTMSTLGNNSLAPSTSPPTTDISPRAYASLDERRPPFARPNTGRSSHDSSAQPITLDYSYARALAELKDPISGEEMNGKAQPTTPNALRARYIGVSSPLAAYSADAADRRKRSRSFGRTPSKAGHGGIATSPDLASGIDRRASRRRSFGSGRYGRPSGDLDGTPIADFLGGRDSTEMAVDDYLEAPRFSRKIKHTETGRIITFSEVGDPDGAAVFVCVGMGLTRFIAGFFDELAHTLRLRLITIDRPGVGASQSLPPQDRRGPLGWPDDVLNICDSLGISKFSVLAHSAGAVYALAAALILPHMINGEIHLLAPWIPPSQLEVFSHSSTSAVPAGALPRSQRILRMLPTPFLKAANASFMSTASASLKPASRRGSGATKNESARIAEFAPPDKGRPVSRDGRAAGHQRRESLLHMDQLMPNMDANRFPTPVLDGDGSESVRRGSLALAATATPVDTGLAFASAALTAADYEEFVRQERYSRRLTQRTWELATKDSNPANDLLVCLERHRDIGFRYTDVQRDIIIHHGSDDKRVPVANVRWLAEQMNRRAAIAKRAVDVPNTDGGASFTAACELRVLTGEGHGLMASPRVMGDVLTEIAAQWYPPLTET